MARCQTRAGSGRSGHREVSSPVPGRWCNIAGEEEEGGEGGEEVRSKVGGCELTGAGGRVYGTRH